MILQSVRQRYVVSSLVRIKKSTLLRGDIQTEDWNAVGSGRHRLANHQQEYDEGQQDGGLKVDLLSRLDGQEEAEERDEEDEKTRCDEVDDVEETAAAHVDRERDVDVRLLAAGVVLGVPLGRDLVNDPLLVLGRVVDARAERAGVVEDVEFEAAVRPRDEDDLAVLRVEREVLDVQRTVSLYERRVQPQYQSVTRHDRVCHHDVIELLSRTAS